MSPIQDSDLLLINRGGRDFSIEAKDILDLGDDDDLLVTNRDGVDYQVTVGELKQYAIPNPRFTADPIDYPHENHCHNERFLLVDDSVTLRYTLENWDQPYTIQWFYMSGWPEKPNVLAEGETIKVPESFINKEIQVQAVDSNGDVIDKPSDVLIHGYKIKRFLITKLEGEVYWLDNRYGGSIPPSTITNESCRLIITDFEADYNRPEWRPVPLTNRPAVSMDGKSGEKHDFYHEGSFASVTMMTPPGGAPQKGPEPEIYFSTTGLDYPGYGDEVKMCDIWQNIHYQDEPLSGGSSRYCIPIASYGDVPAQYHFEPKTREEQEACTDD